MRRILTVAILALTTAACGSEVWFRPARNAKHYEPLEQTATRVYRVGPECDEIGVVFADGTPGELIEPIAREAADNGGDKYILRKPEDTEGYSSHVVSTPNYTVMHTHRYVQRHQAAIVYRCK